MYVLNVTTTWLSCYPDIKLVYNSQVKYNLIAIATLYSIGSFFSVIFNGLFLIAMKRNRSLHKLSNYLLVCLSCIDLVTGISILPTAAVIIFGRAYQDKYCALESFTHSVGYTLATMSFIVVLVITIDQYIAISHPFYYQKLKFRNMFIPMAAVWAIMTVACGISWPDKELWVYYQSTSGCIIVVTYATVVYCYSRIFLIAKHTKRKITASSVRKAGKSATRRHSNKTVITSFSIIVSFTIAYIPIGIFNIRKLLCTLSPIERSIMYEWFQLVALNSSVVSPLVYYWRLRGVRKELYKMVQRNRKLEKSTHINSIEKTIERDSIWYMNQNNMGVDNVVAKEAS